MDETVEMEDAAFNSPLEDPPFWVNPCGFENDPYSDEPYSDEPDNYDEDRRFDQTFMKESIQGAQINVKSALRDAKNLKEYLKKRHPSMETESLPDYPVFNFLKFPEAELDSSNSISNLPIAYNCIQRHGVVLEQMMDDAKNDVEYFSLLQDQKRYMVEVLCSLHILIINFRLRKFDDVTRVVMPEELRKKSHSVQMMRDVIVVKRYADLLHFLYDTLCCCVTII